MAMIRKTHRATARVDRFGDDTHITCDVCDEEHIYSDGEPVDTWCTQCGEGLFCDYDYDECDQCGHTTAPGDGPCEQCSAANRALFKATQVARDIIATLDREQLAALYHLSSMHSTLSDMAGRRLAAMNATASSESTLAIVENADWYGTKGNAVDGTVVWVGDDPVGLLDEFEANRLETGSIWVVPKGAFVGQQIQLRGCKLRRLSSFVGS